MKKLLSILISVIMILSLVPMTVGATEPETWNSFIYYQNGPKFSVKATEFVGSGSYKFLAAAYDSTDKLIDVKISDVPPADAEGTLEADVDFEYDETTQTRIEADTSIDYVKTMLWDSVSTNLRPVAKNGYFDLVEQTKGEDDVYTNLTNGFYEPVTNVEGVSYDDSKSGRLTYRTGTGLLQRYSESPANALYDNNITTSGTVLAGGTYYGQYISALNAATSIDRVVVYYGATGILENDAEFYLSNEPYSNSDPDDAYYSKFNKADSTNIKYLGKRDTAYAEEMEDRYYRLTFDASGAEYQYLIAKYKPETTGGYVQEMQAYKKVTDDYPISELTIKANWDSLTYNQNGPVFSVAATGFTTNATEPTFVATATKVDGTTIVKETAATPDKANATLSANVDFEYDETAQARIEADPTISSVTVEVVDKATGKVLVEEWSVNIAEQTELEDNVYSSLTNGFYEPVTNTEGVAYDFSRRYVWRDGDGYLQSWSENGILYDNNLTTYSPSLAASNLWGQYINGLNAATSIDRVVVYYYRTSDIANDVRFYLSNEAMPASTAADAYLEKFNETDTTTINYLGTREDAILTDLGGNDYKLVFDTDGSAYQFLIADYKLATSGSFQEMQAYKKVTDSKDIPSNK